MDNDMVTHEKYAFTFLLFYQNNPLKEMREIYRGDKLQYIYKLL
jgi:hypothetical protein